MVHLTLTIALSHAISFLTNPLTPIVPAKTIEILRQQLELKLREEFAPSWHPEQPQRGSTQRRIQLSPSTLPPRALLAACFGARLPWSQWMGALGNIDFALFIDPGSVSVLRRGDKTHRIVWSSSTHSGAYDTKHDDEDISEVLDIINKKVISFDSWTSPTSPCFPKPPPAVPAISRLDTAFLKSRSASRLSNSSGSDDGAYESEGYSAPPSLVESASLSSVSSRASSPALASSPAMSRSGGKYIPPARRGVAFSPAPSSRPLPRPTAPKRADEPQAPRGREDNVVVDPSKAKLTVYAGKTTVMSGGVMLSAMGRRA
jgi:hypothetical protein